MSTAASASDDTVSGRDESALTRIEPFFATLLRRDASGRSWLGALLAALPQAQARLGELVDAPGSLLIPLAVPAASGRLACFEYPAMPSRALLLWFIDHPDKLRWPPTIDLSAETVLLRRALLRDDPPGSQARAQDRARQLVATRSPLSREWWRFEEMSQLDCVLITDRLVLTIAGGGSDSLSPATGWYPERSRLVRDLEAAGHIAQGRRWASLLLSDEPVVGGGRDDLRRTLPESAPHLDESARDELHAAYLGNLSWATACEAVGVPLASLPAAVRR